MVRVMRMNISCRIRRDVIIVDPHSLCDSDIETRDDIRLSVQINDAQIYWQNRHKLLLLIKHF